MIEIQLLNGITLAEDSPLTERNGYRVGPDILNPHGIIVRSAQVETDKYPDLLAVARAGAGYDNITVEAATRRGIPVFVAPANANAVTELLFTMLCYEARNVGRALEFIDVLTHPTEGTSAADVAEANKRRFNGTELAGKRISVIGLGNVGVQVANRARALDMLPVGYDPQLSINNAHRLNGDVFPAQTLDIALSLADIVTVHVPLTDKTRHLIGAREIKQLKEGCVLVNFAREGIYDEEAVLAAISDDHVRAYITDFPNELLLRHRHGVIMTPHLGASTSEATAACIKLAADRIGAFLRVGSIDGSVNFPSVQLPIHRHAAARLSIVNRDQPGMIASMTDALRRKGVNILGMVNEGNGSVAYNLIDIAPHSDNLLGEVVGEIEDIAGIICVRRLKVPPN